MEHFESLYPQNSRQQEIEKILFFVKQGNSCQLIGLPGVGRSNLLGLLAYNHKVRLRHLGENQKWFHFVLLNFSEIRNKTLTDATKFIFLGLLDSLRERKLDKEYSEVNKLFKESITLKDDLILFQGLKKTIDYLAIEKELTIVFLFDRFEEYLPMLTIDFFNNLKILRNRAKYRFSVIFGLNRTLEELLEPSIYSDFYEFIAGKIVYLNLCDRVGLDFRISYLEKIINEKIKNETIENILSLTAGHGKLTIASLESLLVSHKNENTDSQLIEYLLSQKSVRSALFAIWNSLHPSERKFLANNLKFSTPEQRVGFDYLQKINLIKENRFTIPIFDNFIKQVLTPENKLKIDEGIIYDSNTGEIKKGDIILSDRLTPSEFKLLKYLFNNSGKTIEREDIINTVWKETKSTLGVTDQAVDQLIFRLRKKIEDDPNNPKHLETIKGRGFKFNP